MSYGPQNFTLESDVTDRVLEDFQAWHRLLLQWNAKINLVSKNAVERFWFRHALDSWQITRHVPTCNISTILDLGSGGGFPGLALAIAAKHQPDTAEVTLVESAGKKASFLRTVIRELDLPATVKSERVETLPHEAHDIISARAFAPLPELLDYAYPFWSDATTGLFLKGQSFEEEIRQAQKKWSFVVDLIPSKTDPEARLLKLTELQLNS